MLGLKRVAGYFSPKYYAYYFKFKSDTSSLTGKKIKVSDMQEISETFGSLTPPKISFERAMQLEGILDSDLPKSHKMYDFILSGLMAVSTYPIYLSIKSVIHKINGGEFFLGFFPSFATPLLFIVFTMMFYYMYSWLQWRIRNRMLITPNDFFRIIRAYPLEALPFNDFNDTMKSKYGKDWKKKLPKKRSMKKQEKINAKKAREQERQDQLDKQWKDSQEKAKTKKSNSENSLSVDEDDTQK